MTDETTRETQLLAELLRTEYVWGNFIHNLCHRFYPEREPEGGRTRFRGTPQEQIMAIFKVMDHEVRHIRAALRELGFEVPQLPSDHLEIFDEVSRATGITTISHQG